MEAEGGAFKSVPIEGKAVFAIAVSKELNATASKTASSARVSNSS
jgi:hypothetical protein